MVKKISKQNSSKINTLIKSLNSKQKSYSNLNFKKPKNGEYLLTVSHLVSGKNLNILQAAEVAAESSIGINFKVKTETPFSRELNVLVYKIDLKKNLVWIAYSWRIFDRGGNVQNILTFIVGNVLGMKEISALKILDVCFPSSMLEQYYGLSYTLDDMKKYLKIERRLVPFLIKLNKIIKI